MKRLIVFALAVTSTAVLAQFPRYGIRQLGQIPLSGFPGAPSSAANIFGYVSASGREYATVGIRNGTAIVEITNPLSPTLISHIPGPSSLWHENTVLGDYCYAISDSTGVGIQIINLANLDSGSASLVATYTGNSTATVHTIQGDQQTHRLFQNGGTRNGCAILDATNPTALTEVGRWNTKYVHDCVVKNYTTGPWAGKQIVFLCCGTAGLYIADTTNPASIVTLGSLNYYPGAANAGKFYCHSASLTPDNRYLIVNDELDELNGISGGSVRTFVVDVQNLAAPTVAATFNNANADIDHNSQLINGFLFLSAYKSGLRIYNASNPLSLSEVGWVDTHQTVPQSSWEGDWGVYAKFPSGTAAISDINQGLILVDPSEAMGLGAPLTGGVFANVTFGGISELRKSDDQTVNVGQRFDSLKVFAETTIAPRTKVTVRLEARGTGSLKVSLRNYISNQMDSIGTFQLDRNDSILTIPNLNSSTYVSGSGQIEATVSKTGLATFTGALNPIRIDMLRFDVQP